MKMGRQLVLIVLTLCLAATSGPAWGGQVVTDDVRLWAKQALAQEQALKTLAALNAVGVLYFFNLTGQPDLDALQKGLTVMLITDLAKVKGLVVVERIRLQALMEEMKLGVSGLVSDDSAPRVGKLLGAHWLVGGNLHSGLGNLLQIKSSVLDVAASKSTGEPSAEGILEELLRMEKDLVFELIKLLKIELTPEEEAALKKPMTKSLKALLDFSRGIVMSDLGNYEEAAKFYERALEADPNFGEATDALQELRSLGLIGGPNKSKKLLRSLRNQTSLTNQLTPQESNKRLITPAPVNRMQGSQPPTPEPGPQTPISQPTNPIPTRP